MIEIIYLSSDEDDIEKKIQDSSNTNLPHKRTLSCTEMIKEDSYLKKVKFDSEQPCEKNSTETTNIISEIQNNKVDKNQIKRVRPQLVAKEIVLAQDDFQKFVNFCLKMDCSAEMKTVMNKLQERYMTVDRKNALAEYFKNTPNDDSELIVKMNFVNAALEKINQDLNSKFHVDLKDKDNSQELKYSELELKRMKKLEDEMDKIKKEIKKVEREEIDWDDEKESSYIREDRLKRIYMQLFNEFCKIRGEKALTVKYLRLNEFESNKLTNNPIIDESIIKFINKNIKRYNDARIDLTVTSILDFEYVPDYIEILECITKSNQEYNLKLGKKIDDIASKAFETITLYFKKQREKENEDLYGSYFRDAPLDPALSNETLLQKLKLNKIEEDQKLDEIINKFVEKQEKLLETQLQIVESADKLKNAKESSTFISATTESTISNDHLLDLNIEENIQEIDCQFPRIKTDAIGTIMLGKEKNTEESVDVNVVFKESKESDVTSNDLSKNLKNMELENSNDVNETESTSEFGKKADSQFDNQSINSMSQIFEKDDDIIEITQNPVVVDPENQEVNLEKEENKNISKSYNIYAPKNCISISNNEKVEYKNDRNVECLKQDKSEQELNQSALPNFHINNHGIKSKSSKVIIDDDIIVLEEKKIDIRTDIRTENESVKMINRSFSKKQEVSPEVIDLTQDLIDKESTSESTDSRLKDIKCLKNKVSKNLETASRSSGNTSVIVKKVINYNINIIERKK